MLYQIGLLVIGSTFITLSLGEIKFSTLTILSRKVQYYINRSFIPNRQVQVIRDQLLQNKEKEGRRLANIDKYELCIQECLEEQDAFLKADVSKSYCVAINVTPSKNVCRLLEEGIKDGNDNGKSKVRQLGDPECVHIYIGESTETKKK